MTKKKLFIIVLILFVLAGASLAVYNFLLKNKNAPGQNLITEKSLKITKINEEEIFALNLGEDSQTIKYYLKNNGHVFKSRFDGSNLQTISLTDLNDLSKILWSPDGKKVIGFFDRGGSIKKYFYDYEAEKSILLNENIKSIAWSPDSQKIVYQYQTADGQYNNISIADPDGTNWRTLFQTRLENLEVFWPLPDKIYILNKPSGNTQGSLFAIDVSSGNLNKILSDLYGLAVSWSPDGQKIIYQTTEQKGKNLKLYVALADGSQAKQLPVSTLVEKCVWSKDSQIIFCAVPQKISESAVLPDDYILKRLIFQDDFFLVDTAAQKETKIAQSGTEQSFDASSFLLSPEEDYLFFINQRDGLLYNIKLNLN